MRFLGRVHQLVMWERRENTALRPWELTFRPREVTYWSLLCHCVNLASPLAQNQPENLTVHKTPYSEATTEEAFLHVAVHSDRRATAAGQAESLASKETPGKASAFHLNQQLRGGYAVSLCVVMRCQRRIPVQ